MGTITSNVGLISGLDYQSIVDQLIAVQARPRELLMRRMGNIDAQTTAYLDVSARVTAILARVTQLTRPATFRGTSSTSSAPDALSVSTSGEIQPGSYDFTVHSLATRFQSVSRGFHERTSSLDPGKLTIESAKARVNRDTELAELNGGVGIARGAFEISTAAGESAVIDLGDALTIQDVLDRINGAGIAVQASVRGDALSIVDNSGGTGAMRISEVGAGTTAASLGFGPGHQLDTDEDGKILGSDVIYVSTSSRLSALNDGLGVRHSLGGEDFSIDIGESSFSVDLSSHIKAKTRLERLNHGRGVRLGIIEITSKDGRTSEVDLSGAETVGDVKTMLESAFDDGRLSVLMVNGHLMVKDNVDTEGLDESQIRDFKIEDVNGHAAEDLGIDKEATSQITGNDVLHMDTVNDVLQAITYASDNVDETKQPLVIASLHEDGRSIVLESREGVAGAIALKADTTRGERTLRDLGLRTGTFGDPGSGARVVGERVVGGMNTVLLRTLNGGNGYDMGTIAIDVGDQSVNVDLSDAETLFDVIDRINAAAADAGVAFTAQHDNTGTRLTLSSDDGDTLTVSDVSGTFAADLGLDESGTSIRSDNLQRQYINENTLLSELNNGKGIAGTQFKLTNSRGAYDTVYFGSAKTVQDVIDAITATGLDVEARINATGDGIELIDNAGGDGSLKVEDDGGRAARDLNIAGEFDDGRVDGSYEFTLDYSSGDTIGGLASRINEETTLAEATLINDGTGVAPYRLSISSMLSGSAGDLIVDDDGNLGLSTLTRAQDARLYYGGSESGILISSSDNTFSDVVDGMTITAHAVTDGPVSVSIERDLEALIGSLNGLVDDYNGAIDRILEVSDYDEEKEKAAILQGESTLQSVERRLYRMFNRSTAGAFTRLSQVGIEYDTGGHLRFDEDVFREAFAADPTAVETFFTDEDTGIAHVLEAEIKAITDDDGLIEQRTESLADSKELLSERVELLNERLERERARLLRQFVAMEQALSEMQSQQSALASLSSGFSGSAAGALSSLMG